MSSADPLSALNGRKILIVDDEELLRETLMEEFSNYGSEVFEAKNGLAAWDLLQKQDIDLVISDIRMAGGDGISLLKQVKARDRYRPAVVLASGFSDFSAEQAFDLGVSDLLPKPFHLDHALEAAARFSHPLKEQWIRSTLSAPSQIMSGEFMALPFGLSLQEGGPEFKLGQGGFFYKGPRIPVRPDELVQIQMKFDGGPLLLLEGMGRVKWMRVSKYSPGFMEYGVLIERVREELVDALLRLMDDLTYAAVIPL